MRRPSLAAVRGFDRAVYVVTGGRLLNVFGSGLVYPFATVPFHLTLGFSLSVVGLGLLANNVALAVGTALGGYLAVVRPSERRPGLGVTEREARPGSSVAPVSPRSAGGRSRAPEEPAE